MTRKKQIGADLFYDPLIKRSTSHGNAEIEIALFKQCTVTQQLIINN
jgi:hypothetical protein